MVLQRSKGRAWVGVWKAVRSEWEDFKSRTTFRVGNGKRVKF